jgi:hypothetical protein
MDWPGVPGTGSITLPKGPGPLGLWSWRSQCRCNIAGSPVGQRCIILVLGALSLRTQLEAGSRVGLDPNMQVHNQQHMRECRPEGLDRRLGMFS